MRKKLLLNLQNFGGNILTPPVYFNQNLSLIATLLSTYCKKGGGSL